MKSFRTLDTGHGETAYLREFCFGSVMKKTIRISKELKKELDKRKMHKDESYDNVLLDLILDACELRPEFIKKMKKREKERTVKSGQFKSLEQIKKETKCK
jgi:hypothetical protein